MMDGAVEGVPLTGRYQVDDGMELRFTRILFSGSFFLSTLILVLLATVQPLRSNIVAACSSTLLLAAGTFLIGHCKGSRTKYLRLFLLFSVMNLLLVPGEAFLRLRGFRYESGMQFGYPRPSQFAVFEPDEKLFWKFPASAPGINSYGFREREVETPKPSGRFRILFIGNSCTYQGHPALVERELIDICPGVECLNFAMAGYTSYQGRILLESVLPRLDPDLVVASFGWNDRWLAYGEVDEKKIIRPPASSVARAFGQVYSRWRALQLARKALAPLLGDAKLLDLQRVPPESFKDNLVRIGRMCSERKIPVIFATEPSSYSRLGVPDYVVESRYAVSRESAAALYREYNELIREVSARDAGWHLADLDSIISGRENVGKIFTGDGIHFSADGLSLVAGIEAGIIRELTGCGSRN